MSDQGVGVPEEYVRHVKETHEDARTQVKASVRVTGKITVRVGLHQGSSLSPELFDMILDVQGETLTKVKTITYLGSTLSEDGELDAEITNRVQSGWKNWKRVSGVLCDRKMNVKIKGNVYRTVVRPDWCTRQRQGIEEGTDK